MMVITSDSVRDITCAVCVFAVGIFCAPISVAGAPFPDDQCAVIIASRPTLREANDWANASTYKVDVIYNASNGYFAVSAGVIPKIDWRNTVGLLKAQGIVPPDAYCSARGIIGVAAVDPADAERKILATEAARLIAEEAAARARAEKEATEAKRRADLAEERAANAEREIAESNSRSNAHVRPGLDLGENNRSATRSENSQDDEVKSSGTGFRFSEAGTIITNNHVVKDCAKVTADGVLVEIEHSSATFDLAVLSPVAKEIAARPWLPLSTEPPRLNSDVVVAGYPLHGLLGGINVTRGTITSLRGLGGDDNSMQISAPIQNGNSGGAVADRYGRVVGVVVSKLDGDALKAVTGMSAENVNFSIRGDILKLMLDRYSIKYDSTNEKQDILPEDLADKLIAATALVECR